MAVGKRVKGGAKGRKPVERKNSADKQGNNSGNVGYGRPPKGRPFQKGQSGNPAGRPKSVTFSEACRRLLAEIEDDVTQETVAEALARTAIQEAKSGSAQHLKEINDRVEGKARQSIDLKVESPRDVLAALLGISADELPEPKQDAQS